MKEDKRNTLVGLFVAIGLIALGWLVFRFGELPNLVNRVNAYTVTMFFPEAPGIETNAPVQFKSFPVGRVLEVNPPRLLPDSDDPLKDSYQVTVVAAIDSEYTIPANVTPRVYRRGLGGSYIELKLDTPPSPKLLQDSDKLQGSLSEASDFVSEETQHKLERLITSMTTLSESLYEQVEPLPPEQIDQHPPGTVRPNVTTAVMRLDTALRNLNIILGDIDNQKNVKQGLADFAQLTGDMRNVVDEIREFGSLATEVLEKTSTTVDTLGSSIESSNTSFTQTADSVKNAADELAVLLHNLNSILLPVSRGEGTAGRVLNDPRLYEALTDTIQNLNLTVQSLHNMLEQWQEKGVQMKLK